uniref:Uncharacterized protein n=1 Tax=Tetradesmus obliquus TaxID=3088 RepID=A0A383VPS8_TETOB|eukprot:jgi/Sobl393_1/13956/SZX66903.1
MLLLPLAALRDGSAEGGASSYPAAGAAAAVAQAVAAAAEAEAEAVADHPLPSAAAVPPSSCLSNKLANSRAMLPPQRQPWPCRRQAGSAAVTPGLEVARVGMIVRPGGGQGWDDCPAWRWPGRCTATSRTNQGSNSGVNQASLVDQYLGAISALLMRSFSTLVPGARRTASTCALQHA